MAATSHVLFKIESEVLQNKLTWVCNQQDERGGTLSFLKIGKKFP